jgi:prevent-host-death family protein
VSGRTLFTALVEAVQGDSASVCHGAVLTPAASRSQRPVDRLPSKREPTCARGSNGLLELEIEGQAMPVTTAISSRELRRAIAAAKRAAADRPVVITDRGRPSHVLLTYDHYLRLAGTSADIVSLLAMSDDIDGQSEPAQVGSP